MIVADQRDHALAVMAGFAVADAPLAPLTTYKVGGAAAVLASPRSMAHLAAVATAVRDTGMPVLVVGRGSNLLVADGGFAGIAVSLADLPGAADRIEVHATRVVAGAGVSLPVLARRTVAFGLTGFEWAVGVPGSLGGGVRMNAGGHGSDIAASLVDADVFDLRSGRHARVPASRLGLRFRGSDLAAHQLVLDGTLELAPGDVVQGEAMLADIVRWRREHQPGGQNAGSVFVNPVPGQVAAGQLIDSLGLRGTRVGGAFVSDKHANFIQASEGATAADVRAVIELVRAAVHEHTGHLLRSEVRLIGFSDVVPEDAAGVAL